LHFLQLDGTPPPLEMPEIPDDNVLFRDVMMKLKQKVATEQTN
jgi:hypothetical protein